jgi:hypothetical protein
MVFGCYSDTTGVAVVSTGVAVVSTGVAVAMVFAVTATPSRCFF